MHLYNDLIISRYFTSRPMCLYFAPLDGLLYLSPVATCVRAIFNCKPCKYTDLKIVSGSFVKN